MNAQRNMKTRRSLFSPIGVTLLVAIIGGLASSSPSARAAQTATIQPTKVESSLQIPVRGTVTDPNGTISVGGYVTVDCTRVIDTTTLGSPSLVLLTFDFSKLRGMSGTSLMNLKVYVTGGNRDTEMRPLQASDVIAVACPYYDSSKDILSANSWQVTTTLNFDVSTGKLTSGSATVGNKPASL